MCVVCGLIWRKARSPLNRSIFFPPQNGSRVVGSLAVHRCVCRETESVRASLLYSQQLTAAPRPVVLVSGPASLWSLEYSHVAKSKGVAIETLRFPTVSAAHLTCRVSPINHPFQPGHNRPSTPHYLWLNSKSVSHSGVLNIFTLH